MNVLPCSANTVKAAAIFLLMFLAPAFSYAADLEIAGWIPYWRDSEGIESAEDHIRDLDVVHPFAYSVRSDGSIEDLADLEDSEWEDFFETAERRDVEIIPTVMWSDGASIHRILSDEDERKEHIEEIVDLVRDGDFDGIDIDYEAKLAETIDYYSLFLEELKDELGRDTLTCTIEARTPPESMYREVPENIRYANDYEEIGEHCDRVEIMAYDQRRADYRLNNEKKGQPYVPVSDVDWVEKVLELALLHIPNEKILLGTPTYGQQYEITVEPDWYRDYTRIGALNVPDILDIADEYDVEPSRNKAGEMSFTYFPESSIWKILRVLPVPEDTEEGNEAAAQALLFSTMTGMTTKVNVAWYSDAGAIEDKIDLAEKYDLRGVAIFKIDGEEDSKLWRLF